MGRTQSGKQVLRAEAVNIVGLPEKKVDGKVHYQLRVFADDGKGQKFYWTVFKRYSDFNTLRSEVDAKWGGQPGWVEATHFLAGANQHFPPKTLKGTDERVVAERKEVRWPCV